MVYTDPVPNEMTEMTKERQKMPEWMNSPERNVAAEKAEGCLKIVIASIGVVFLVGVIATLILAAVLNG